MNSNSLRSPQPPKRAVTIKLDDALVAQIETLKAQAHACGIKFSITDICAAALTEALPRVGKEVQRYSNFLAQKRLAYLGNGTDS